MLKAPNSFNNQFQQIPIAQALPNQPFFPPRPIATKPQPRPEPMDIDRSIHSRQINYMNRPQIDATGNRPSIPIVEAAKRQRNFNIQTEAEQQTETEQEAPTMTDYEQTFAEQEEQTDYEETLNEYTEIVNSNDQEQQYDYTYLNFLE